MKRENYKYVGETSRRVTTSQEEKNRRGRVERSETYERKEEGKQQERRNPEKRRKHKT